MPPVAQSEEMGVHVTWSCPFFFLSLSRKDQMVTFQINGSVWKTRSAFNDNNDELMRIRFKAT